jgi:ParB/RepB/Spo0J family partition protein
VIIQSVPVDSIQPNPLNIRRSVGDVTELADSIRAQGLIEPLVVALHGTGYTLIAGHRRLAAAQQIGLADVTVVVRTDLDTDADQVQAMLVENLQRVDITPVEEGRAYAQLLAFDGITAADIAQTTGRAVQTVKSRASLARLPEPVQDSVHTGDVTLADALAITEFNDDPPALAQLEKALGTYEFRHILHGLRQAREAVKAEKKTRAALKKAGVPVLDKPDGYPWSSTVKSLERMGLSVDEISEHAGCPGHAAVIDREGAAEYVCQDPTTHHHRPAGEDATPDAPAARDVSIYEFRRAATAIGFKPNDLTDEQRAQVDAALLEEQRTRDILDTAQQVRDEHITALLATDRKPPADALALFLAFRGIDGDLDPLLTALGKPIPDELYAAADEEQAIDAWFIDQVLAAKPDTLARLALAMLRIECENDLDQPWFRWNSRAWTAAWFAFLTRHGYPITPEETAKVTPPAEVEA